MEKGEKKLWQVLPSVKQTGFLSLEGVPELAQELLFRRGLHTEEAIQSFLNPEFKRDIHDPFLISDMNKLVVRIKEAQDNKEKVIVYGDYDADGVCSSAVMYQTLKEIGLDVSVFLPHREEDGYGMNIEAIKRFHEQSVKLIVTVDCGVTNVDEIAFAKEKGIDVIVTDHHQPPDELPEAFAVINPHLEKDYPFSELCGAGVAWKVSSALARDFDELSEGFVKWLLDLVAIATIADLMPLLGENRTLVIYGLIVLQKTRRIGLLELFSLFGLERNEITGNHVGWKIAPAINAVGRLGHAQEAFDLLVCEDREEARKLAQRLQDINSQRQKITTEIVGAAREQIGKVEDQYLLFAYDKSWATGVVGLAAGRLSNQYSRPAIVVGSHSRAVVGSGRSIPGINITDMLQKTEQYLDRFGGHEQACGFSLKKDADPFEWARELEKHIEQEMSSADLRPRIEIDLSSSLEKVNWSLVQILDQFAPFGPKNEEPVFHFMNVEIFNPTAVGTEGKHLRGQVKSGNSSFLKCIGFGFGNWIKDLDPARKMDIVCVVEVNEWNGKRDIQLRILDMDFSGEREIIK